MNVKSKVSTKNLPKLFKNEKGADVHFVLKSNVFDGEMKVPAHKIIMAMSSPVFDRMFFGEFEEVNEVKIEDASFEGFCEFLQLFYLNEIHFTEEKMFEVFKLVDKYDVQDGMEVCQLLIRDTVTRANVCLYYELALTFEFLEKCTNPLESRIRFDTRFVLLLSCSHMVLEKILKMDSLYCCETLVFDAVISWATEACINKSLSPSPENLRAELGDCLSLVRFPTMTAAEYSAYMEKYPGLLDHNVLFDIMNYITSGRPLTCAQHFNTSARKNVAAYIGCDLTKNVIFTDGVNSNKSHIFVTASKDYWLTFCDFIFAPHENSRLCKIHLNGALIQDYTALQLVENSLSHQDYKIYRLYFSEPILCKMGEKCDVCFELDECLNRYFWDKSSRYAEMNGVRFDFQIDNHFVHCPFFKDKC